MKYKVAMTDEETKFEFFLCRKENVEKAQIATEKFVRLNSHREWSITILDDHGPYQFGMTSKDDAEVDWSAA